MAEFIEVSVVPHPQIPGGFSGRWKIASNLEECRISEVFYSPDEGEDGQYRVVAAWADGRRTEARRVWVEDSAAGVSGLLVGGDFGLRLERAGRDEVLGVSREPGQWLVIDRDEEFAEPYLLVDG